MGREGKGREGKGREGKGRESDVFVVRALPGGVCVWAPLDLKLELKLKLKL